MMMKKRNPLPEDMQKGCSLRKVAGGVIESEVLALIIFKQPPKSWRKIPLGWFSFIKANRPPGSLGSNFPFENLQALANRGLVDYDDKEVWITNHGVRKVFEACGK